MKKEQKLWTREELILVINFYLKTDFGKMHSRNPDIIELAKLIGRTPGSVSFKLVNFASLDPSLIAKGASNVSKLDVQIWDEFFQNWNDLPFESEKLRAELLEEPIEVLNQLDERELPKEGIERERVIKTRVNQGLFRKTILTAYEYSCCITGINKPELLIAGHIRPWSLDEKNRMNPRNGLSLNALHDKAFENGLISISPDYNVLISSKLKEKSTDEIETYFLRYENKKIILPKRFMPDPDFLDYHVQKRFLK